MKKFLYAIVQCTWGILQTLAGFFIFLINIKKKHYFYHGAVVTEWASYSSVSLGLFLFYTVSKRSEKRDSKQIPTDRMTRELLVHEYGHTIQSLVLGPLYLLVIGLPSLLWATLPKYQKKRMKGLPYSAFWTESSANRLGEKVTKEKSLQDVVL